MEGNEEEGEDGGECIDTPMSISLSREGEARSSTTETTEGGGPQEREGNEEGDPNADDYSARDRAMHGDEAGEDGDEDGDEDDLSSYRGIKSTISYIQPVNTEGICSFDFTPVQLLVRLHPG